MPSLDDLDRAILAELEENARIPISELARRLDTPSSTIRDRMRSLEQDGVILGYTALVNPAKLRLLIQGVTEEAMKGIPYGAIPWRLGLLEQAK